MLSALVRDFGLASTPVAPRARLIICSLCYRPGRPDMDELSAPTDEGEALKSTGTWQFSVDGWLCPSCVLRHAKESQN